MAGLIALSSVECPNLPHLFPPTCADQQVLTRYRRHARRCEPCESRLSDLVRMDESLRVGLSEHQLGCAGSCPEPEALAAWIEGARKEELIEHLVACASCRQDVFLAARVDLSTRPRTRNASQPFPRLTALLVAATVLAVAGMAWVAVTPNEPDTELASGGAAPPLPGPVDPPPAIPDLPREPSDSVGSQGDPRLKDAITPVDPPAVPGDDRDADVPAGSNDPAESQALGNSDDLPDPAAVLNDPQGEEDSISAPEQDDDVDPQADNEDVDDFERHANRPSGASGSVLSSVGLRVRSGSVGWRELSAGDELAAGDTLKISNVGGVLELVGGEVYLSPRARASYDKRLRFISGQAFFAGSGPFALSTAFGSLELRGRVFLEARRSRLGIICLEGAVRCTREATGEVTLVEGQRISLTRKRLGRPRATKPGSPPAWLRTLQTRIHPVVQQKRPGPWTPPSPPPTGPGGKPPQPPPSGGWPNPAGTQPPPHGGAQPPPGSDGGPQGGGYQPPPQGGGQGGGYQPPPGGYGP